MTKATALSPRRRHEHAVVEPAGLRPQTAALVTRRRIRNAGLTLVETVLLVSIAGVVLAVGVPAFVRGLRTSKSTEAVQELERMFDAVAHYYATPQPDGNGTLIGCLPDAAGPTPEQPSQEPLVVEFGAATSPGAATWRAIGYEPASPLRYRYSLRPVRPGCGTVRGLPAGQPLLWLRAEGDLDGDGVVSRFERSATERDGKLVLDEALVVHDRVE
jgi:Tfp pilus assembly protein PilE